MTSPDLPSDAPAQHTDVAVPPPAATPTTPVAAGRQWRWLSRRQSLGLAGAFLLGACLCGGVGLAVGAVVSQGFDHRSNEDGRSGSHGRDNAGDRRQGDDGPGSNRTTPTTPATTAPAATTPAPSVSPTPTISPS